MDDPIYDRVALCDGEGSRCATGRGRTLRRVGVALCDPALIRYIVVLGRKTTLSTLIGVVLKGDFERFETALPYSRHRMSTIIVLASRMPFAPKIHAWKPKILSMD